jgi:cellulose synthase/poly-beta-1,6-N-acetylglucosamine synthase-like glycosyltransferase
MVAIVTAGLTLIACLGVLVCAMLFVEALAMLMLPVRQQKSDAERSGALILVPAHNEAEGIVATVRQLRAEMVSDDRLLVIADNCSDDTAAKAADAGADMLIRNDPEHCGKGYALAAGLAAANEKRWQTIVFIDADCWFAPGSLDRLVRACLALDAPVQGRYLMVRDQASGPAARIAEFAWRLRNDFRPAGAARLGLPCQLFGAGMALPARLIRHEMFATGHVTEDLLIGVECTLAGAPPRFLAEATIYSTFPETQDGRSKQKTRWIHGHLSLLASHLPKLLRHAIIRRDRNVLATAGDLMVPPLTMLAGLIGLSWLASAFWFGISGHALALWVASAGVAMLSASLAIAWYHVGRDLIGWRELMGLAKHAGLVLRSAKDFARGRRSAWVRADRTRLR